MLDWLWYLIISLATAPIWGTFIWHTWQFSIRPRFIPQEEIDRIVAEMQANPHPEEAAFTEPRLL